MYQLAYMSKGCSTKCDKIWSTWTDSTWTLPHLHLYSSSLLLIPHVPISLSLLFLWGFKTVLIIDDACSFNIGIQNVTNYGFCEIYKDIELLSILFSVCYLWFVIQLLSLTFCNIVTLKCLIKFFTVKKKRYLPDLGSSTVFPQTVPLSSASILDTGASCGFLKNHSWLILHLMSPAVSWGMWCVQAGFKGVGAKDAIFA